MKVNNSLKKQDTVLLMVILLFACFSCRNNVEMYRSSIDLSGNWQFELDSARQGLEQKWFSKELKDSILLPGTTDLNLKGNKNTDTTTIHLNRVYTFEGPAWYRKKISIPRNWHDRHICLFMERTKPSEVWVDNTYIGKSILLESPQQYDLSEFLTPGEHTITIKIDNSLKLTPYGWVHIYSEDTQTNWNGIIGKFYLEASAKTYITNVQVYPDIENQKIKTRITIQNPLHLKKIDIELQITKELDNKTSKLKSAVFTAACDSVIELEYVLGNKMDLWDEYHKPVYTLNTIISDKEGVKDNLIVPFGMRKFAVKGTQFSINNRITFLRGKHDACVFPLTGYPPTDTDEWIRIFNIAKSYGINHYRFHTWSPPEAAFEAADRTGIYLEPELPFWGGLESDTVAAMLEEEGAGVLRNFANHPSFVMFSAGNEIWSGHQRVKKIITELKEIDNRPLYTQGSNNNIGYVGPMEGTDFQVAARTPYSHDTILTHTRLTQAYVDSRDGGILNTREPSADITFDYTVSQINMPLISHEMGQYQIFPDYKEIAKYTGVLQAWNLEIFRNRLEKAGMLDQNADFTKASGAWSALCYKAEIEAALRTKGLAGFQLLDLQDFPGQGTALVGILDAFMDSKQVISREDWLQFCNDVVPLLVFEKYCWTTEETFSATLQIANYSDRNMKNNITWKIIGEKGNVISTETIANAEIPLGGLQTIGNIELPLKGQQVPEKLSIMLTIDNTGYANSYPIWVYPEPSSIPADDIIIATSLNDEIVKKLQRGNKVLLFPQASVVKMNSVGGLFPPDFWNYGMFKGISEWAHKPVSPGTLGILTNPDHPLFNDFPTDFHTNWQWWSIIRASNPLILDATDKGYRPIVQIIDNLERNHKLGLIFEFKAGEGKLLVCMSRLDEIQGRPEACQLYRSIINYMKSDLFNPTYVVDEKLMLEILH
jgi:hypothetical protein